MKVMYPGSFDPITIGHLDLIERCSAKFEEVIVAIMINGSKSGTFTLEERLEMVQESIQHMPNVKVEVGEGLTIEFAQKLECDVLVRGIRAVMDYEYELQQATANRILCPHIETLFLVANPKYSYISSSVAKEIAKYGGAMDGFVTKNVARRLEEKYRK
ncbi:pantetheine-phosphate adenylyltransferase [Erysipelothrix inopinata]|uniref:Phosphopantetheine adenylyltransferase n=1 Tax=Erysipelothrix inopinata TaxID=225084 RepID=A0A7G9RWN2_9FIRM|nr:pantetheine-phosphate adenylyltransferase [Erysipelothrix inopinata]QNN60007.1 pantetheine-phosphate adenylyltransferase [Erysipelothrix inopinata]